MRTIALIAILCSLHLGAANATPTQRLPASAPSATLTPAQVAFEKLKSLAGSWTGPGESGKPLKVTFEVASGGTTVISRVMEMVDVYHLDGERLMVTHYCSAGNQPRLVTETLTENSNLKSMEFKFLDITHSSPSKEGYINHLTLNFTGDDNLTQWWTFRKAGESKEGKVQIQLSRVK
jgi:hypothetical protein